MISSNDIEDIIEKLKLQRHRDSTRENYYRIWKIFSRFYLRLDVKPNDWSDRLTLFVGYLISEKKQSVTVRSYISTIRSILIDDNIKFDADQSTLNSLTKACSYVNDKVCCRLPIQKNLLYVILQKVEAHFAMQPYLKTLYQALFAAAYYGLLRISEVMGIHAIKAADVQIALKKSKLLFMLRTSKTHWKNNRPQLIKISKEKNTAQQATHNRLGLKTFCPFRLLNDFVSIRGGYKHETEHFFVYSDKSPVQSAHV